MEDEIEHTQEAGVRLEPGRRGPPPAPYRSPLLGPAAAPPAERPFGRYLVQAHHPKRYWEHIADHRDEDRALLDALRRARVGKVAYRVWDRKKGKEVWRGYGHGARVEKWATKKPEGLVGSNVRRFMAQIARRNPLTAQESQRLAGLLSEIGSVSRIGRAEAKRARTSAELATVAADYNGGVEQLRRLIGAEAVEHVEADWLSGPGLWVKAVMVDRKGRGMQPNPRRASGPPPPRLVRKVGTVPWDSPEYQGYALMSDGQVWLYDRGTLKARIGPLAEFVAQVTGGRLRGTLLPGAAGNPPRRYRYNLHSKKERERLAGDLLAQQGLFKGAVSKGRFDEATRILGWFQGVTAAAQASGAPRFYIGRLRVVTRRLDRMLPEHPRRVGPPPEPWETNRGRARAKPRRLRCNPRSCRNRTHRHAWNADEDRNKDLGSIEWHKIPKGALVVESEYAFTYHTTKGFYLVTWGSRDARQAQLHLKKMAREAWGKNPLTRREAADLLSQARGHIVRATRYRAAGEDAVAEYALGRAQGKASAVRQHGPRAAGRAARKLLERQTRVNPHAGLTGLMNVREARRVERFS